MLGAGRRDTRVTFERASVTQDEYNADVPSWAPLVRTLAMVRYGTGAERRTAAMEGGQQALTLRVLDTALTRSVTLKDRAVVRGQTMNIVGISPLQREIEFTVLRAD